MLLQDLYARNDPCHDISHAIRVARLAERIAVDEGTGPTLPVLAALFHDCGHAAAHGHDTDDHETRSALAAADTLRDALTPVELRDVVEAIEGRRFRKRAARRTSTGAILDDADNLDAIGLTGFSRALLWLGRHAGAPRTGSAASLDHGRFDDLRRHWDEKLSLLADGMRTETGRRLARPRHHRLADVLEALDAELDELRPGGPEPGLRVAVVGPIGAGKTVLAELLARRLGIPHLCLDDLYWGPGWQPVPEPDFVDSAREALAAKSWVSDGVHGGRVADLLWERTDLVVWLDLPRWLCVTRACRRAVDNIRHRRLLWGVNIDSWRRFFGKESIGLIALRHHSVAQAEIRDRLANPAGTVVRRLSSRREVVTWLNGVDVSTIRDIIPGTEVPGGD
ncbi:HD domain-containing protein [Micromonospora sp. RP3T]|uniref:HD domain-containing protein n=1 Tax=Micromonospora sp. RP3T TaxID=2135446 RepID=UPI003D764C50